jgi:heme exporter protein A
MPAAEAGGGGLAVRQLRCTRGARTVFAGLSFDAPPGVVVQVRGSNGSGKSSLLRLLCGLLEPARGEVRWERRAVSARDAGFAADVAYLGHACGMAGDLTVLENLRFALHLAGRACPEAACREALAQLGLAGREDEPVRRLSQGQRRRLALARVLLSRRPLWLLDEPCDALDEGATRAFEARLAAHAATGGVAVVSTHRDLAGPGRDVRINMDALGDGGDPAPADRA